MADEKVLLKASTKVYEEGGDGGNCHRDPRMKFYLKLLMWRGLEG